MPKARLKQLAQDGASNGDVLTYSTGTGLWAPAAPSGGGGGVGYNEFLLDNEPTAETGATDASYTPTYSGIKITKEEWKRNDTTLVKSIDYTYTGMLVTTEVRKVFASNGSTIVAQVTWTYSYTGFQMTSATMVRNV